MDERRKGKKRGEGREGEKGVRKRWQGTCRGRSVGERSTQGGKKRKKKRAVLKGVGKERKGEGSRSCRRREVEKGKVGESERDVQGKDRKGLRGRRRQRRRVRKQGVIWCTVTSEVGNTKRVRTWRGSEEEGTNETNQSAGGLGTRHRGTDYSARRILRRGRGLRRTDVRRGEKRNRRRKKGYIPFVCVQRDGKGKGSRGRKKRVRELSRKVRTVGNKSREPHNGCRGKGKRSV